MTTPELTDILGDDPEAPVRLLTDEQRAEYSARSADQLWYDPLIMSHVTGQEANKTHLLAVSVTHRGMATQRRIIVASKRAIIAAEEEIIAVKRRIIAAEGEIIGAEEALIVRHEELATAAEGLAESIPSGDQAAADLGMVARQHDDARTLWVVEQEQLLNQQRDQDVRELRGAFETLATEVRAGQVRAQRERQLILQALSIREEDAGDG